MQWIHPFPGWVTNLRIALALSSRKASGLLLLRGAGVRVRHLCQRSLERQMPETRFSAKDLPLGTTPRSAARRVTVLFQTTRAGQEQCGCTENFFTPRA